MGLFFFFFSKQSGLTRSYGLNAEGSGSKYLTQAMQEFRRDAASLHLGEIKCFKFCIKHCLPSCFKSYLNLSRKKKKWGESENKWHFLNFSVMCFYFCIYSSNNLSLTLNITWLKGNCLNFREPPDPFSCPGEWVTACLMEHQC